MEAIKLSELPSGDRMPLADEDGVPIIASQENRLLTWGRLKKQLAEQTHASTVATNNDTNKAKVPTNSAVATAIKDLNDDLTAEINTAKTNAETAVSTANTAKTAVKTVQTTAESALGVANTAKSTADTAKSTVDEVATVANTAKTTAESALETANSASTTANEAKTAAESVQANAVCSDFNIWQIHQKAYASGTALKDRSEVASKEILEAANTSFADSIVYFNNNFTALTQIVNAIQADLAGLAAKTGTSKVNTALTTYTFNSLTLTANPSYNDVTAGATERDLTSVISNLQANQETFYQALLQLDNNIRIVNDTINTLNDNINTLMTEITTQLNNVV